VLMSLEPAIATVAGFLILREGLTLPATAAVALVTIASIGATRAARTGRLDEPVI